MAVNAACLGRIGLAPELALTNDRILDIADRSPLLLGFAT
jgi:hypothetical protein